MTLDEAIEHADDRATCAGTNCEAEHAQLAEWLRELKLCRSQRDDLLAALAVCADQFDAYAEHHKARIDFEADDRERMILAEKWHRNQLLAFNARAVIAATHNAEVTGAPHHETNKE